MKKKRKLTDGEWSRVFTLRCKTKQGQTISQEEHDLVNAAFESDKERYGAMEPDVFNETVPFGSTTKWGSRK
jgi:hypothetical protein